MPQTTGQSGEFAMLLDHATGQRRAVEAVEGPSLVPDRAIDLSQLARTAQDDSATMWEMLRVFDLQIDVLMAHMTSEAPKIAAARAHSLAVSASSVGAWKISESAMAFEQAALSTGPVVLRPAMNHLSETVTEAQVEIHSLLIGNSPNRH
jgi:HPt (histidine-containing phosphotransfer) domain-containing protein